MVFKQRSVSCNLGKNIISHHEKIYNHIESNIGPIKKCTFGHIRGSKTGVKHEGDENVSIRNFELKGCRIQSNNEVSILNGDGLQGFCKDCSRRRRAIRSEDAREKNKGGYDTYQKEYGKNTKKCSSCKEEKEIRICFKLSPSMECGIHNVCIPCSTTYGASVGDRIIKYRPDGNYKYEKKENNQHDDHIFPLCYGGTDDKINHQLLSSTENLKKSNSIPFHNIMHINPLLLSSRWRPILYEAQREKKCIQIFKSQIASAIRKEQEHIFFMEDSKIYIIFKEYFIKSNRRISNIDRYVKNFKKYCIQILKLEK